MMEDYKDNMFKFMVTNNSKISRHKIKLLKNRISKSAKELRRRFEEIIFKVEQSGLYPSPQELSNFFDMEQEFKAKVVPG